MYIEDKDLEGSTQEETNLKSEEELSSFENIGLSWFALRVLRNEERCVSQIKEHIALRKLQDKIVDVKYFKEYAVVETEEYEPRSDLLPKKGFKATPTSQWVRLPNGNYKRIRVLEKKPLSGMVFIKMQFDLDLFKMIRSWDAGYSFLGTPSPIPMSEAQLQKTAESLHDEAPDIKKYAEEKGYQLVEGPRTAASFTKLSIPLEEEQETENQEVVIPKQTTKEASDTKPLRKPEKKSLVAEDDSELLEEAHVKRKLSPEEEKEAQKAKIYSELNIKENLRTFTTETTTEKPKATPKKGTTFNVNDFVFIKHLGFKGTIQEINYEEDKVVVGVQMFGRRQPVECKISDIQLI